MTITISVVTPTFNAQKMIVETIHSVVNQSAFISGRAKLQYLVQDGGSQDDTVQLALTAGRGLVHLHSCSDQGMYDALAQALKNVTGEIVCYINAGDMLMPGAFDAVLDIFEKPEVMWLSGMAAVCNEAGLLTATRLPFRFRPTLIACGAYGSLLPWMQQEAIFWRRELLDTVDYEYLAGLKLAGDCYLWTRFASQAEPHVVQAVLGVFKYHRGQLSENIKAYKDEVRSFTCKLGVVDIIVAVIDRLIWVTGAKAKKFMNPKRLLRFDHARQTWF